MFPISSSFCTCVCFSIINNLNHKLLKHVYKFFDIFQPFFLGKVVINAADSAGLDLIPMLFGCAKEAGKTIEVCGKEIKVQEPLDRESVVALVSCEHLNMIVVDYTVPVAVNSNAELYCNVGVPFVMGTTGGDRDCSLLDVLMAALVNLFKVRVMESHQSSKLDTSGTAKAVISCFEKLGVSFDMDQIQMIRDPKQQMEMVGVPEEYLSGHMNITKYSSIFYGVSFEFQHNVCGRSIEAEGTVDAVFFLAKKIQQKADQRIYNMIDVLRGVA
ncbi:hypothetical protein ACJRO7_000293 [Eucalyptus globulus]|uniref:4-hydroxy-tetrahydrodipicolinate reductase n=1 Tax=Eucalyptus globulus TaxID=34317 RepID=A0ABD3LM38_EUCGL